MKSSLKFTLLASSLIGLALASAPGAQARYNGWNDRNGSISTSPDTGGYCDRAGCPDHFWRYPIHYGPVFVHRHWYRGPLYFRGDRYGRQYWVDGGWHRDEWRGPRPAWARQGHDGPPMAFEYYSSHGFQMGDRWRHQHDSEFGGGNGWNGQDHRDNGGDGGNSWHGGDNTDQHSRGDNGSNTSGSDWHGGGNDTSNNDQNRPSGSNGSHDSNTSGNWHGGNGGNGQTQAPAGNTLHVTAATYGATCHQPSGNVTKFLADACNGRTTCDYVVQYQTIGDPAPGCAKDFSVQWTCSAGPGGNITVPAEAGRGSKVALQCSSGAH